MILFNSGNAIAYSRHDKFFIKAEQEARKNNHRIWASKFENPEQYRKTK